MNYVREGKTEKLSETYLAMSLASSENSSSVQGPPVMTGMEDDAGLGLLETCEYDSSHKNESKSLHNKQKTGT